MTIDLAQLGLSVETRQVRTARRDLDRLPRSARNAERSVQSLTRQAQGMGRQFGQLQATISRFIPFLAGGLTAAGLTRAATSAVQAFAEFERQQLTTQQVLRATGGAAGRTAEQIEMLAQSIAAATLTSETEVRQAAQQLLTFRSVATESFDRTLRAAQDLAAVGFGSITSNAVALGRAMEDPTQGLTLLRRAGISFTQSQRDMINALMDSGRELEAQALILDQIEAQVGGAGAAAGGGLSGAYDALSQAVANFTRQTGAQIAALLELESVMSSIAGFLGRRTGSPDIPALHSEVQQDLQETRALIRELEERGQGDPMERANVARDLIQKRELEARLTRELSVLELELERTRIQGAEAADQAEAAAAARRAERFESTISNLNDEREALSLSNEERRIRQELARAGVDRESEEGQQIAAKVEAMFREQEALRGTAESRRGAASASREQADAAAEVIRRLEEEIMMHGMSEQARRTYQELQRAGVELYSEEGQRIADLVEQLQQLEEQNGRTGQSGIDMANRFGGAMSNAFSGLVNGSNSAEQAISSLLNSLNSMLMNEVFQMLFSPQGAGGPIGGFFQSLLGGLSGGRAAGGPVMAGGVYPVGERGPELFMPNQSGSIVPNHMMRANDNGGSMGLHITVGLSRTADGDLKPFVEDVSRRQAGNVVAAASPRIVEQSTTAAGGALARGDYDRGMSRYGVSRTAKVR